MERETFLDIFDRTIKNCEYFAKEGKSMSLSNEIGVLRGIAYCMEIVGLCPHTEEFAHFIELQEKLKKTDC